MQPPTAIMFHSVGLDRFDWVYPHIAEPPGFFANRMAALARAGYSTAFFATGHERSDGKVIVLTFDDGYLDNWVHVFPVLAKHGMRATIFVTPEFVDPRPIVRQRVEPGSMLDEAHEAGGCCAGFLSWLELREMERSGLVDVQCHGLTHTWHFKGPRVVDFWRPGAATEKMGPIWLLWNTFPDAKPYYLTQAAERESDIPYGAPIYEHGKALETRRFFPDPDLEEELTAYVRQHGGVRFFDDPDWRGRLTAIANRASAPGRFETDEDHVRRIRQELSESRAVLSQQLGKTIDAICWPGGGVNDTVLGIAREIGYRHFTLPSAWREAYARGQYRDLVPRIGSRDRVRWRSRDLGRPTPREFVWHIESARNSKRHRLLHRCAISVRLGWSYLKRSID